MPDTPLTSSVWRIHLLSGVLLMFRSARAGIPRTTLGDDPGEMPPPKVRLLRAVRSVSVGDGFSCALLSSNEAQVVRFDSQSWPHAFMIARLLPMLI